MTTRQTQKTRIGWIGLGYMGELMALRLLDAGYPVTVYNRTKEKTQQLAKMGATIADTPYDVAQNVDYVLSCLTNYDAVRAVMYGEEGAIVGAKPGTVFIEMSSIGPDQSYELAQEIRQQEAVMLDAPVAGSTPQAKAGELVIFVGGDERVYAQAKPILAHLSKASHYIGENGKGTTMKMVVNAILVLEMQAIAEAAALGEKAGIEHNRLMDVLSQTAVIAPAHAAKLQNHKKGTYPINFSLELAHKDLGLVGRLAAEVSVPMPATMVAHEMYTAAISQGFNEDFSEIMRFMAEQAGISQQKKS